MLQYCAIIYNSYISEYHLLHLFYDCISIPFFHFVAPGTYSPEKVNLDKSPRYSFGLKTSYEKTSDIPGK